MSNADLKTMSKRVESEQYYVTLEMFVADVRRMFSNARTYNSPETIYYKCSTRYDESCIGYIDIRILFMNLTSDCWVADWKHILQTKFKLVCKLVPRFSHNFSYLYHHHSCSSSVTYCPRLDSNNVPLSNSLN